MQAVSHRRRESRRQLRMAALMVAALGVGSVACDPTWAQAHPTAPAMRSATQRKAMVSPYARAARARETAGKAPVGHAPTMVVGPGKSRARHAGAPVK